MFAGTLNGTGTLTVRVRSSAADFVVARIVEMVTEASADQGPHPAVHRAGRAAVLTRHGDRDPAPVRRPAAARRRLPADAAAGDDVHDRRIAVRGRPGDHAAAAGRDGQRRPPRRPGQVRRRHGGSRDDHAWSHSTRPAPSPRAPPGWRRSGSCRAAGGTSARSSNWPQPPRTRPSTRWAARSSPPPATPPSCRRRRPSSPRCPGAACPRWSAATGSRSAAPRHLAPARNRGDGRRSRAARTDGQTAAVDDASTAPRPQCSASPTDSARRRQRPSTGSRPSPARSPVLLTGDNDRAARKLASQAGIADVRAGLLPAGQGRRRPRTAGRRPPGPAGRDGVNDAPALAAATTGVGHGRHRLGPGAGRRRRRHHARRPGGDPLGRSACRGAPARSSPPTCAIAARDHHRPCLPGTWPATCRSPSASSATRAPR